MNQKKGTIQLRNIASNQVKAAASKTWWIHSELPPS